MWNFLIPAGMAALSAVQGAGDRAAKRQYNSAMANASRYDYLTGKDSLSSVTPVTGGIFGDMASGGAQGLALSQSFNAANKPAPDTGSLGGSSSAMSNPFEDPNYQTTSRYGLLGRR